MVSGRHHLRGAAKVFTWAQVLGLPRLGTMKSGSHTLHAHSSHTVPEAKCEVLVPGLLDCREALQTLPDRKIDRRFPPPSPLP